MARPPATVPFGRWARAPAGASIPPTASARTALTTVGPFFIPCPLRVSECALLERHGQVVTVWRRRGEPCRQRRSMRERFQLCPGDLWVHAASETAVGGADDALFSHEVGEAPDALE